MPSRGLPSRSVLRRTDALRAFAEEADLPWDFVADPEVPHFRLQLRKPNYAALALTGRRWTLSAEGDLPFETIDVTSGRARPRAVAHDLVDAALRIGVDAITADRRGPGEALVEAAFDLAVALGDARRAADAAFVLGDSAAAVGDASAAASWFEVAVGEAERLHDPTLVEEARAKRHAATRRAIVEFGRTPELAAELTVDRPVPSALAGARPAIEEPVPDGFARLDVARSIGLADLLVAALATPRLAAAEFDGGSGYWPGGVVAETAAGIRAEVSVFSEFGYRVAVSGPGVERRELPRILDNDAHGDALFSALLGAVLDVELDVAAGRVVLAGEGAALGADAVARDLDAHALVLGERASRRVPPSLEPQERLRLGRYASEFPGRAAGPAIAALLADLGGPGRLSR